MKSRSLKIRFAKTIFLAFILFAALVYLSYHVATHKVVDHLGAIFAAKEALLGKSRLMSAIQGDLSLSLNMARSPVLGRWVRDENDLELKKQAFLELENYRRSLYGRSLFLVVDNSRHYYFADGEDSALDQPRYTLKEQNLDDSWYFRSIREVENYELNVDLNNQMGLTKIWFNVIMRDENNHKIGICGGGIDITEFIENLVNSKERGIRNILFRRDGAITGHHDKRYVLHNSKTRGDDEILTIFGILETSSDEKRLKEAIESVENGQENVKTFNLQINGRSHLAAISYIEKIDWFNLVLVDPSQYVNYRSFIPILAVIAISALAILITVSTLLNRLVLSPLTDLAESSRVVAGGSFDSQIQVRSNDEIGSLAASFNFMTQVVKDHMENLEAKIKERTEELDLSSRNLAESNRKIMESLRFARAIQSSILPEESEVGGFAGGFFAIYRPRDIVGGDFYYMRKTEAGLFIAVADCTGHGVPGAFMTMTGKALLDRVLDDHENENPGAILTAYNCLLQATLGKGHDKSLDNGMEIGLCRILPDRRHLVFAGARIDLHFLAQGGVKTIAGDRQAIGYRRCDLDFTYTDHVVALAEEMTFYMITDGILDQAGGPKGWGFGRRRFRQLLEDISPLPHSSQKGAIEEALVQYQGDLPQRDDMTVIGFNFRVNQV